MWSQVSKHASVLVAICGLSPVVLGGEVRWEARDDQGTVLFGATVNLPTPTTPLDINLGVIGGNGIDLHIFDLTSDGIDSVGMVTVFASAQPTSTARLRVLVSSQVDNNVDQAFTSWREPREQGFRNFGGLRFLPAPNSTLPIPSNTLVNVTVLGDITGDITAGNVFRVDARLSPQVPGGPPQFGGTISGNITSNRPNGVFGPFGNVFFSIGYVRAQWELTGNIEATLASTAQQAFVASVESTHASIDRVVVGPTLGALGLKGNIIADYGRVQEVFSSGPVGSPTDTVILRSGMRTGVVRVRQETSFYSDEPSDFPGLEDNGVLDRDIYMNLKTSLRDEPEGFIDGNEVRVESGDLFLLETKGDYFGNIEVNNVYGLGNPRPNDWSRQRGRQGIFVGGDFHGSITSKYNWLYADIIARSVRGPITIGQMLKGSIVAVGRETSNDPLDGTLHSVSIGLNSDLLESPVPCARPGMSGTQSGALSVPFETGVYDDSGTTRPAREKWYLNSANDFGTIDSVVRAATSIGSVNIFRMSNKIADNGQKFNKPRIESPLIGSLAIGRMDNGVVWSGRMNSSTTTFNNAIEDDFASVNTMSIGCVSPMSDLWV
jgi:hypothetical protein